MRLGLGLGLGRGKGGESAPYVYTKNAVVFDAADSMENTSFLGVVGGKRCTLAFWMYAPTAWPTSGNIFRTIAVTGGPNGVSAVFASLGRINFSFMGVSHLVPSSTFTGNTWYQVLLSMDTTAASRRFQVYVNGTRVVNTSTIVNDTEFLPRERVFVSEAAAELWYADVWWSFTESLNFDDAATRAKFGAATDKGKNGELVTGTRPALYLSGATTNWHLNKGSGGGFTLTGALTTAGSLPV